MKQLWIIDLLGVFLLAGLLLGTTTYNQKEQRELEQLRLSYAIDYCSDAAVENMLNTDDLEMDYKDFGKIKVDPNLALDTFLNVFCENYNMSTSNENKTHIRTNFMPAFVVCAYDGYYMGTPQLVRSASDYPENKATDVDYDLVFGPKMPYDYTEGANVYALNLGGKDALRYNTNAKVFSKGDLPVSFQGTGSYGKAIAQINTVLTNKIGTAIDTLNKDEEGWSNTFYLPSSLTSYTRVNPVVGPSVIALVQNVDLTTSKPISAFSIAGSRLQARYHVACYIRKVKGCDIKYYCYMDKLKPGNSIIEIVDTVEDAAKRGYSCDIEYMTQ